MPLTISAHFDAYGYGRLTERPGVHFLRGVRQWFTIMTHNANETDGYRERRRFISGDISCATGERGELTTAYATRLVLLPWLMIQERIGGDIFIFDEKGKREGVNAEAIRSNTLLFGAYQRFAQGSAFGRAADTTMLALRETDAMSRLFRLVNDRCSDREMRRINTLALHHAMGELERLGMDQASGEVQTGKLHHLRFPSRSLVMPDLSMFPEPGPSLS